MYGTVKNKKEYEQTIQDLTLMLLYLTRVSDNNEFCRYRELSWKGYDFEVLNQLENAQLLWQPQYRRGYEKYLYLTEEGRRRAQELLEEYSFSDKRLNEKFEFRNILPEETEQAIEIEKICFPPNEACSAERMRERILAASELFLVGVDRTSGRIAGFLNGIATDEYSFRDEFFTNADLHTPNGKNIMLLGLDVLPEYRGQGLARELVFQYLRREWNRDRKMVFLTCLKPKVKMYEKMGFRNCGLSESSWGGEQWYEMNYVLNM